METIGERIKYLRKVNNLTVEQLAELIDMKKGSISSYENNRYEPSAKTIVSICEQFNVSADWLLTGKEPKHFMNKSYIAEEEKIIDQETSINNSDNEGYFTNFIFTTAGAGKTESMIRTSPGTYFISGTALKGMIRKHFNDLYEKISKEKNEAKENVIESNVIDLTNRIEKYLANRFVIEDEPKQKSEIESYASKVLGDISEDEVKLILLYRQLTEKDKGKTEYFIERIIEDYARDKKLGSSIFNSGEEATAKDVG